MACDFGCAFTCQTCASLSDCTGSCTTGCYLTCVDCAYLGTCSAGCENGCTGGCGDMCSTSCISSCKNICGTCAENSSCMSTCSNCSELADCTNACAKDCDGGAYMSRPANFTGFSDVITNATSNPLTATDWNAFTDRIIAFAKYKSKGDVIGNFDSVSIGQNFTAGTFNQAVGGLNTLSSFITEPIPATVSSGDDLYALYIQKLKNALNSIN